MPLHDPRFIGNEKAYPNECIDTNFVSRLGKFLSPLEDVCRILQCEVFLAAVFSTFIPHRPLPLLPHTLAGICNLEDTHVKGFISTSNSTEKVMCRFITNSTAGLLHILLAVIRDPSLLKSIFETYNSTHTVSCPSIALTPTTALPSVGYLSIVVASTTRQGGIGTRLLTSLETALQRKGIEHYKVVAGSKLTGANRFYRKNGFEKVARVKIHGEEESNVYVKRI